MDIGTRCHICGFVSINPRCPRCNALKLASCTGSCTLCRNKGPCSDQKSKILGDVPIDEDANIDDTDHE